MICVGRSFTSFRSLLRPLCSARAHSTSGDVLATSQTFRTSEANPANHGMEHEGRFYRVPKSMKNQLFSHGGLPKTYDTYSESVNELGIMVRKPGIELISYLKQTNFDAPVTRYVLYGKSGTGKSLTLAHILHYGSTAGYVIVHVPWVSEWNHRFKEMVPSTVFPGKYDLPVESVEWLKHFSQQNGSLLKKLDIKTTETYTWSKREITESGSSLTDLIEHGLNRGKYASGCVAVIVEELKRAALKKQCRVLAVIDGFNAFFSDRTRGRREDKSIVLPTELVLASAFLSISKNDWNNGAVVLSVDPLAATGNMRRSHLPRYLLGKEGFEHIDPFIPIEVNDYSEKEMQSQIDYYAERKWLQQPKALTERGRAELTFSSGRNPYTLMSLVAPY